MTKQIKTKAPEGHAGELLVTISTEDHFSITGEISTARQRQSGNAEMFGCIHDQILEVMPQLAPLVAMHLSRSDTGEPIHAIANSYYWLAGALGGLGEKYHGAKSCDPKSQEESMTIFADYIRCTPARAKQIAERVMKAAKMEFVNCIEEERPRWKLEAEQAIKTIESL
jgi:hypothetical protein